MRIQRTNGKSITNRRNMILRMLSAKGRLETKELISLLNVSDETIRKDLIALEEQGIIKREYGAALLISRNDEEEIEFRNMENVDAKNRIAQEALKYIPEDDSTIIAIDAGSTTWCLARLLSQRNRRNIITNSIPVAELFDSDVNNVYLTGGDAAPEGQIHVWPVDT
ncbi:MAG: DeoR/GlpR family DNA-binding transcription regulator [Acetivibrionales bacterium]